jgi:hypothetical protein
MSVNKSHDKWIQEYLIPRHPELVSPILDARQIAETALKSGLLSDPMAERLERYCLDSRSVLSENVAVILGQLTEHFESAKTVIERLASDAKVRRRSNALVAVDSATVLTSWHECVILRALTDRSTKIRLLAASKALRRNLRSAIPLLQSALASERNESAKRELRYNLDLLQTGYHLQQRNGSNWLTIKSGEGTLSAFVSDDDLRAKGLAACAAELSVDN